MRNTFTACLLLVSLLSFSQSSNWCGSIAPQEYLNSYATKDRSNFSAVLSSRDGIKYIPVYYHLITQDDGTGGVNLKAVFDSHCELNTVYNAFGIGFFIKGIDTIKSTTLWNFQSDLSPGAFRTYNKASVCNVYVNGNLPGLCGFATFPFSGGGGGKSNGGIFLNKDCVGATTTTYPHEMGHYLGLLHTFDNSFGVELINGSNCSSAGDLFCDTPADFIDFRTACPYAGSETDANGDFYRDVIDESLYMSYFNDNCVSRFSDMQKAEMLGILDNQRASVVSQTVPDVSPLGMVDVIGPLGGDNFVNSQNANFLWHSVPNAELYYFHLQSATSAVVFADIITSDTFFVATNLQPSKKYKYILKAISYGNTCGTDMPYQVIQTSAVKLAVNISTPICNDVNNGTIDLQPSGGKAPYSYEWYDGSIESSRTDVAGGDYPVTVTDANSNQVISIIHVAAPAPVTVQFGTTQGKLTAFASGGTSPYSYEWSNGVNTQVNNNASFGFYQITVTDTKGCSTTQDIAYTSIGAQPEMKVSIKIFPNPSNGSLVNVQLELNERMETQISLMDINGQLLQQYTKDFHSGTNSLQLNLSQLPSGIYLVKCQGKDASVTERISLIR